MLIGGPDSLGRLAWGPPPDIILWPIILLAWLCMIFAMLGNRAATLSRCFFVSGWCSCQLMMLLKLPCITASAALFAHCVLNTKICEDC